ncbi:MAG: type II toxin-antitoxin system RelE family toxin [Syntrophales bacterium]
MYNVFYQQQALKTLRKLPAKLSRLIREKINQLARDPHAPNPNVKLLEGRNGYLLRIGDWRVLYELLDDRLIIVVIKIKTRGDVYK